MTDRPPIKKRLRDLREAAGLTQAALARLLGSSTKRITNVEGGTRRPSLELIERWAEACGQSLELRFTPLAGQLSAEDAELRARLLMIAEAPPSDADSKRALLLQLDAWQLLKPPGQR